MSNKYEIIDKAGKILGVIEEESGSFIVKAGAKRRSDPSVTELRACMDLCRHLASLGHCDTAGVTTIDVYFNSLAEAAKSVAVAINWEDYTYVTVQGIKYTIKEYETDKIDVANVENKDTNTDELDVVAEDKENTNETSDEQENEENLAAILGDTLVKLMKPRPMDISKKSMKEFEKLLESKEVSISDKSMLRFEEIINKLVVSEDTETEEFDFDWGEDESGISLEDVVGVDFNEIDSKLRTGKGAVMLVGVPGTGKTKAMMAFLNHKEQHGAIVEKITFHQEYTCQEFIGGYFPHGTKFRYVPGIFTKLCYEACKHPETEYYLGIDEFSRGNPEAILGEVMTAICTRGGLFELQSGRKIKVPKNLFIIAAMNITDNSTKDIDLATDQRFVKVRLNPQWNPEYMHKISNGNESVEIILQELSDIMIELNGAIANDDALGVDKVISVRDITLDNPDVRSIVSAIEGDLVNTIKRTTNLCYGTSKDATDKAIKDIRKLCKDAKNNLDNLL